MPNAALKVERFVAIGATTVDHIRCTLECNHGPEPDPSAPLFFTVYGGKRRPMSASNVQRIVARCADEARSKVPTVPESVYPHMLRRTRATDLYQGGAEIELVSAVLGHEKVETTRVYAKPSTERMREVMEAASPVPAEAAEKPLWVGREEELARLYGLRL